MALRGEQREFLVILCVLAAALVQTYQIQEATVYWDAAQKSVILNEGVLEKEGGAYGYYNDTLLLTGWGVLEIRAGYGETPESDETTSFLAGYLEGFLTAEQMFSHYANIYPQMIKDEKILDPLKDFMIKQDYWTREQVKLRRNSDPLWLHAGLILSQLDGLQAGAAYWAKSRQREPLSMFALQFLNEVGDLLDLIPALTPRFNSSRGPVPGMGHCSALIKVLPGFENLLLAHSSWFNYASTMRIYKHWDFRLADTHTATGKISFSSYPGFLTSLDDFYLLGSGLLMTQTTNSVFNTSLFTLVTPHSLLAWQRVRLAHALARTGEQWAHIFSKYNSGYWASYNVPFHADIYNLSGYGVMWRKHGEDFSYDLCPRAKIFRRDQSKVTDLASLKHIMRYNNYRKDPYSKGHPCKTICCRNDLRLKKPRPGGCYDTKVTDFHLARQLAGEAVNGPTTQGGLLPFSWSHFNSTAHKGLPQSYNFSFISMKPTLSLYQP
ncbi:phospholipase B-like 1 isoform X2 [Oncorhynchus keta]|uniref:phospholipase B-like 1 isoform X2 n=1 Tax=Oncorhynchus keta TaxID=8018 RepID=UPI0015F8C826|nr:phospholipase B-like 1 isoform X2 [Oncorhynchus keta]